MTGHTSANWVPCEFFLRGLHVESSLKSKLFLNNNEIIQVSATWRQLLSGKNILYTEAVSIQLIEMHNKRS